MGSPQKLFFILIAINCLITNCTSIVKYVNNNEKANHTAIEKKPIVGSHFVSRRNNSISQPQGSNSMPIAKKQPIRHKSSSKMLGKPYKLAQSENFFNINGPAMSSSGGYLTTNFIKLLSQDNVKTMI